MKCPECRWAHNVRAAYPRGAEWALLLLGITPFRCSGCYQRFYRFFFMRWF